jgi:hypothetical protein
MQAPPKGWGQCNGNKTTTHPKRQMHRIKYHQITLLQRFLAQQFDTVPTKHGIRRVTNGRVVGFQDDILGG